MMDFIGKAFVSALIGKGVEKLASILEVSCFKGKELNDESRQKLRIVLLTAKAVLIDVEAKQISNPALKEWVRELTDAVYVAEALLDKIDTEIGTSRCQSTAESQTRKRKYSDFISSFVDLFVKGSGSELQNILQKLEYMTQQKDFVLGLIEVVARDNEERENSDSEETNSDNEETENSDNEERENSDSEETNSDNEETENSDSEETYSDNEETENSDDEETENSDSEETYSDNEEREKSDSEETVSEIYLWLLKDPEDGENSDSVETDF